MDRLETLGVKLGSFGTCSGRSTGSNCMGLGTVVWGCMVISCGGNGGCGGDGSCSVIMVVDAVVFGLGSSWMSMNVWVA
jgi:hypothetical protein